MQVRFVLRSKQSCEVFDGTLLGAAAGGGIVVYRITQDYAADAELKVIADGLPSKILSVLTPAKSVDLAVRKNLFLEALGNNGVIAGTYEMLTRVER